MPGLRASVLSPGMRPRRWVTGRAAQLGTDRRAGGARWRAHAAAGAAIDLLSTHRRLAAGADPGPAAQLPELEVNIRPLHQSVRPSPVFLAIVALTDRRRGAGLAGRGPVQPLAYVGRLRLRGRRLSGVAVPARVRARLHRVALRRPRRRGARLPDPQPAEVLATRCCRSACPQLFIALGGIGLPGGAVYVRTSWMTKRQKTLVSLAGPRDQPGVRDRCCSS